MRRFFIALFLLFNGCASSIHVISPEDCVKSCNEADSDYVGIIYVNIGNKKERPTLEDAQAGCLCRHRENTK